MFEFVRSFNQQTSASINGSICKPINSALSINQYMHVHTMDKTIQYVDKMMFCLLTYSSTWLPMCVCIRAHMHIHVCLCICIYVHICLNVKGYMYIQTNIYGYTQTQIRMYIYIDTCIYIYMCMYVRAYVYMCACMHDICIYIHVGVNICICKLVLYEHVLYTHVPIRMQTHGIQQDARYCTGSHPLPNLGAAKHWQRCWQESFGEIVNDDSFAGTAPGSMES